MSQYAALRVATTAIDFEDRSKYSISSDIQQILSRHQHAIAGGSCKLHVNILCPLLIRFN